jgi:hypothetical protein
MTGKRAYWVEGLIVIAALCGAMALGAAPLSRVIAARFGGIIERVGNHKIMDAQLFVQGRLFETCWLLSLGAVLCAVGVFTTRLFERSGRLRPHSWIYSSLIGFVFLNIWVYAAMQTCVFWGALYTGKATANLTQFTFKKILLKEHPVPRQLLLVGSSQTQAQVNEDALNQRFRGKLWTTELHYPGANGLDLLMIIRRLKDSPGQDVACYVSENYFYSAISSESAPYFFRAEDIGVLSHLGFSPFLRQRHFAYGLLGETLPLFYCRQSLADRFLGQSLSGLPQKGYDTALETNLAKRAESMAPGLTIGTHSRLNQLAFEEFVVEARRQGRRVILFEGQYNPLLGHKLNPELRADMKTFLRRLRKDHPNVLLVPEEVMPAQTPEDYRDLTHVNEAGEAKFTEWLASYIDELLQHGALVLQDPPRGREMGMQTESKSVTNGL